MRFSKRHGFSRVNEADIKVRHDAPYELRGVLVDLAYECGFSPKSLRTIVCRVLRKRPDSNNWSEYPNINEEVRGLLDGCEWYQVYDVVEALAEQKGEAPFSFQAERYEQELNSYFLEQGIGWKLENAKLEARAPESIEKTIRSATKSIEESGNRTASKELHEALVDLSRRPSPDVTGSIQHAMASLECVARQVTGDHRATLGEIIKRYPDIVPAPLNTALEKLWGFASEYGRHIREGRDPEYVDAQLVVGICAAIVTYLIEKKDV